MDTYTLLDYASRSTGSGGVSDGVQIRGNPSSLRLIMVAESWALTGTSGYLRVYPEYSVEGDVWVPEGVNNENLAVLLDPVASGPVGVKDGPSPWGYFYSGLSAFDPMNPFVRVRWATNNLTGSINFGVFLRAEEPLS